MRIARSWVCMPNHGPAQQSKPAATNAKPGTLAWPAVSRSLFIRTMTVGPGITPGLLTLPMREELLHRQALAGLASSTPLPPVGNYTPP